MTIVSLEEKDKDFEEVQSLHKQMLLLKNMLKNSQNSAELDRERAFKQKAQEEVNLLQIQFKTLKQKILQLELKLKESDLENLALKEIQAGLEAKCQEMESSKTNLELVKELEEQLKIAQQHLAKKLRIETELYETVDAQAAEINSLYEELDLSKENLIEWKKKNDEEKQQQTELRLIVQSAESLAASWEEKYHHLYALMQEKQAELQELKLMEDKYRELKLIEGKYQQMYALWQSFNHTMTQQFSLNPQNLDFYQEKRPYQNLFDLSKL